MSRSAGGHVGSVMSVFPGDTRGSSSHQPFPSKTQPGIGGVKMQGLAAPAQLCEDRVGAIRRRECRDRYQQVGDAVGREITDNRTFQADGELASNRWIRPSCTILRNQNPAVWSAVQVHTTVSGPHSRTAVASRRAPAINQADRGPRPAGTSLLQSDRLVRHRRQECMNSSKALSRRSISESSL